ERQRQFEIPVCPLLRRHGAAANRQPPIRIDWHVDPGVIVLPAGVLRREDDAVILIVNGNDDALLLFIREEVWKSLPYNLRQVDAAEKLLINNHSGHADNLRLIVEDGF